MSRIGNQIIAIPSGVEVTIGDTNFITVKGPKGQLQAQFNQKLIINQEAAELTVARPNNEPFMRKIHGTTRALLSNMVIGTHEGFKKQLEIRGVGYRAQLQGRKLVLALGFSHPVEFDIPEGLEVEVPKPTDLIVSGIDKQAVGEFAAKVRAQRKPEPYKGKGIRYVDEFVRRKAGKTAK